MADERPCSCCAATGWHESECGGRHHCTACDGTGGIGAVIDMGYLSLPAGLQAAIEAGDVDRHG